jgi:hypothetical protein
MPFIQNKRIWIKGRSFCESRSNFTFNEYFGQRERSGKMVQIVNNFCFIINLDFNIENDLWPFFQARAANPAPAVKQPRKRPAPRPKTPPPAVQVWCLTSPLALRGEICLLGGIFTPGGWTLSTVWKSGWANREFHSQGTKFIPGGQLRPWGQSLPLGTKLRMGLSRGRLLTKYVCP